MQIQYHGHAFFEVTATNGTTAIVDPFMDGNPWNDATPEDFDPDIVAVTHGHFDHVAEATAFDTTVVCQPEITGYLGSEFGHEDFAPMNTGGSYDHDGLTFTMLQAFHSSGTPGETDFEGYGGMPASYLIDDGETRFFHAGDTGLFGDMKTVVRDVYEPDVAAVPIGDTFTMGIEEAAIATEWLGVDDVIPIHYDTLPPIEADPAEFVDAVGDTATVHVLDASESLDL